MENFVLSGLVTELSSLLTQAGHLRLGKLFALNLNGIALDVRLRDNRILCLQPSPSDGRFYLTTLHPRDIEARTTGEPPLLHRLRKDLAGATLSSVFKPLEERSVTLTFSGFDVTGEPCTTRLRLDLMGRGSNLYWLGADETILDVLRPTDQIIIGTKYYLPPQADTFGWDEITPEHLGGLSGEALETWLRSSLRGCGRILAREIVFRTTSQPAWEAFVSLRTQLTAQPSGYVYSRQPFDQLQVGAFDPHREVCVSPFPLKSLGSWSVREFPSLHEAVDTWFQLIDAGTALTTRRQPWLTAANAHLKRTQSALKKLTAEPWDETEIENFRKFGELIFANIKTGQRTPTGLVVVDYYDPDQRQIEIPVDEDEELSVAAQKYFRRYQKLQRALAARAERLKTLQAQLESAQTSVELLREAHTEAEIDDVVATIRPTIPLELRPKSQTVAKPGSPNQTRARQQNSLWSGLRHYRGPNDFDIYVGRTSQDNDRLTFKLARPNDIWLHSADYPGAHVVIRNLSRQPVPHHVVVAAAELAAFFSQAKGLDKVNVHYTERKFLARPKQGAPGMVLVLRSKTLIVPPREVLERVED